MKINRLLTALAMLALLAGCKNEKFEERYVRFSDYAFSFGEDGGSGTMTVTANVPYTVNNEAEWVKVEVVSTSGEESVLNVTVEPNLVTAKRSAMVFFKSPHVPTGTLNINQDAHFPTGVDVDAVEVAADATTATFNVSSNKPWVATCDNPNVTITPDSGSGSAAVTVSFPENTGTTDLVYTVVVTIAGTQYPVTITSKHPLYYEPIAEWIFSVDYLDFYNEHFKYEDAKVGGAPNPASNAAGFLNGDDSHYCPAVNGNGKIRFWNGVDKTAMNPDGRCKRGAGNSGEPCWYGNWKDDIVYFEATPAETLPAGTQVNIWFCLRPSTMNTLRHWLLEIKDGEDWVAVGETTAKGDAKYNIQLIYNKDAAGTAEDPQQINTIVNRDYTLKNAASKVEYRMTCTTLDWADGMGEANPSNLGLKSDGKKANPVLRIAGKSSTGGAAEIDHNTWIAIVK